MLNFSDLSGFKNLLSESLSSGLINGSHYPRKDIWILQNKPDEVLPLFLLSLLVEKFG